MSIDDQKVKQFWEAQAQKISSIKLSSVTNLEENEELAEEKVALEEEKVFSMLQLTPQMRVLDLGAGVGVWSEKFARRGCVVDAVEYTKALIEVGKKHFAEQGIENVVFHHAAAQDFVAARPYDLVFISGLLLYLNDRDYHRLLQHLVSAVRPGGILFLREGTGILGRHEINNSFSEALHQYYSALYRTREEFVGDLGAVGFLLYADDNMFPEGHRLNKFPETRLRVYSFTKQ